MKVAQAIAFAFALTFAALPSSAGEAEINSAQATIESQLKALLADDGALAYSYAAPNIKRLFPTQDAFMAMVRNGYPQVHRPQNYAFGKAEQVSPTQIIQQVLILGPDGKDYEAVYTLELQADGVFRITGVSLRGARVLST